MSSAIGDYDCDDDPCHPLRPYISFGCVVFPVFIVVWYHYSKQECRRNFGKDDDNSCGESVFERMEGIAYDMHAQTDGADNISSLVFANRFVKWINRRNIFAGDEEYHIETRTMDENRGETDRSSLRITENENTGRDANYPKGSISNNNSKPNLLKHRKVENIGFGRDCFSDDFDEGDDDSSSLFWECIPNVDRDPFEFCSSEHSPRNRDKTNPSGAFDNSIKLSESSDRTSVPNENPNTG